MEKLHLHASGQNDHINQLEKERKEALKKIELQADLDKDTKQKMKEETLAKYKKLIQETGKNSY